MFYLGSTAPVNVKYANYSWSASALAARRVATRIVMTGSFLMTYATQGCDRPPMVAPDERQPPDVFLAIICHVSEQRKAGRFKLGSLYLSAMACVP